MCLPTGACRSACRCSASIAPFPSSLLAGCQDDARRLYRYNNKVLSQQCCLSYLNCRSSPCVLLTAYSQGLAQVDEPAGPVRFIGTKIGPFCIFKIPDVKKVSRHSFCLCAVIPFQIFVPLPMLYVGQKFVLLNRLARKTNECKCHWQNHVNAQCAARNGFDCSLTCFEFVRADVIHLIFWGYNLCDLSGNESTWRTLWTAHLWGSDSADICHCYSWLLILCW